jgi:hypothetical protein
MRSRIATALYLLLPLTVGTKISPETADRYLSGDVRTKRRTAEAAATLDPSYCRKRGGPQGPFSPSISCPVISAPCSCLVPLCGGND